VERDKDRYGRIVAVCKATGPQGLDIDLWIVSEGWTLTYRNFSKDYVEVEGTTREAGKGLWRGLCAPPWDTGDATSSSRPRRRTTIVNAPSKANSARAA